MKKRIFKTTALAAMFALVFLPTLTFAQGPEQASPEEEMPGQAICNIREELGLSNEQAAKLKEQRFQESYQPARTLLRRRCTCFR